MRYNGWKNYETWVTALWLSNDYYLSDTLEDMSNLLDVYELSEFIENLICENSPDAKGVYGDLLTHAINNVDFYEIAENYVS